MVVVEDEDEESVDEDAEGVSVENDTTEGSGNENDEAVTDENNTATEINDDSDEQNDLNECIEVILEIVRKLFGNTAVVEDDNSRLVNDDSVKDISWSVSVEPHSLPILEVVSSIVTTLQNCSCAGIATDKLLSGNTIRTISDKVRFAL